MIDFVDFVAEKFDELKDLFIAKHQQYGTVDSLANFRNGSAMRLGKTPTYNDMYQELLGYARKHIAFVMTHNLSDDKVDESLKDIAVYCIIALYMRDKAEQELSNICKRDE